MSARKQTRPVSGRQKGRNAAIGSVAGGIAHDINTIITLIYGYSEMALESPGITPEAAQNIQRIISAADRAKMLTGELIEQSRSASREKKNIKVDEILDDTVDFIRPSLPGGIRIRKRILDHGACIKAAPSQLFRIFLNLFANAIRAMREKGGTITVSVDSGFSAEGVKSEGNGRFVLIRFRDTGTGMDEETASLIFRPYYSGEGEKGTGLGLTVVNDSVMEMGGRIRVSSLPGAGTTFDLIIPDALFDTLPEKH